jgi:ribulose-phosphate 3-epimerase
VPWRDWIRTVEVEPSIYAADMARLGEQVQHLLNAGARVFHFDVGDGHFVEPITMGPVVLRAIAPAIHAVGGVVDVHLMVTNPEHHFEQMKAAGGDSVTFHVEVADDPDAVIAAARGLGLGAGVACNPGTPVERLADAAGRADLALCMSIEPGYSGQAFMSDALARIERLRALLRDDIHVQVDGGIGSGNVAAARAAGANLLVAGTAVFGQDDVGAAYRVLAAAVSP